MAFSIYLMKLFSLVFHLTVLLKPDIPGQRSIVPRVLTWNKKTKTHFTVTVGTTTVAPFLPICCLDFVLILSNQGYANVVVSYLRQEEEI